MNELKRKALNPVYSTKDRVDTGAGPKGQLATLPTVPDLFTNTSQHSHESGPKSPIYHSFYLSLHYYYYLLWHYLYFIIMFYKNSMVNDRIVDLCSARSISNHSSSVVRTDLTVSVSLSLPSTIRWTLLRTFSKVTPGIFHSKTSCECG